jgi:phenylacetic acid degradation operon negative regulatory protein
MHPTSKADDWLALLLCGADLLLNPSPAKILENYESWDYRRGLGRHLRRLQQRQLLQSSWRSEGRTFQLTNRGRLHALGGRDPVDLWQRPWDGQWRMLLFDLPTRRQATRVKLIRWLRQHQFGYLQHSVWIHPDPVPPLREMLIEWAGDAETVTVMEATCAPGYSDAAIVGGAWDFEEINRRYEGYVHVAAKAPQIQRRPGGSPARLGGWLRQERAAWLHAVSLDPLLPEALLPPGYLGQRAAGVRQEALASAQQFLLQL